jgi:hypothetical protein
LTTVSHLAAVPLERRENLDNLFIMVKDPAEKIIMVKKDLGAVGRKEGVARLRRGPQKR